MGAAPITVAAELRAALGLSRVIETGTFQGEGAREFSKIYPSVVTIELNEEIYRDTKSKLGQIANINFVMGDSGSVLPEWVDPSVPTFYFLDGHWSGGPTGGVVGQCPVMAELAALGKGHADDCIVIDDARQFLSAPPPPYNPDDWPTIVQVIDAMRDIHPDHHITILDDQVFAVPRQARAVIDRLGQRVNRSVGRTVARWALGDRLAPWSLTRVRLRRWAKTAQRRLDRALG